MKGYIAHESFWTDLRMIVKMIWVGLILSFAFQITIFIVGYYKAHMTLINTPIFGNITIPVSALFKYYFSCPPQRFVSVEEELQFLFRAEKVPLYQYKEVLNRWFDYGFDKYSSSIRKAFRKSFYAYYFALFYIIVFFIKSRIEGKDRYVRGTMILPISRLNKLLKKGAKNDKIRNLRIGKSIIPRKMETTHILILGAAGSGKSVLLNQLLKQINGRKDKSRYGPEKAIIYDLKGEYIEKHYTEEDYIFSPFDLRSVKWSFFNEIKTFPDFDVVAKSLYTVKDKRNEYFYNCAKDVFRAGLIYLYMNDKTSNTDIWNFFSESLDNIKRALSTLPLKERGAIKHIEKEEANSSANIVSVLQERIQFFRYLIDLDGDFSLREYIRNNSTQNLYLLNIDLYKNIFKPLMSLVVDIMIREILSLPDDLNRRIFIIIDELGSLYKLESVLDLVTIGRSKGAPLICANQDLGRLEETYGKPNVQTLFNNFNSLVVFRINEPKTAEFLSQAIGEQQIIRSQRSSQISPTDYGDRKSYNEQEKLERIMIPSELQSLKDFQAILRVANYGLAKTKILRIYYDKVNDHFIMKDFALKKESNNFIEEVSNNFEAISYKKAEIKGVEN